MWNDGHPLTGKEHYAVKDSSEEWAKADKEVPKRAIRMIVNL